MMLIIALHTKVGLFSLAVLLRYVVLAELAYHLFLVFLVVFMINHEVYNVSGQAFVLGVIKDEMVPH